MPLAEATFVMTAPTGFSGVDPKAVEQAMLEALQKAQAEGITDPDELRARILAGRDAALEA